MFTYLLRRLILLPITLFCIILVNFVIINLAPGDPVSITEISPEGGAMRREGASEVFGNDDRYLQFREFYGLTLPILFNYWPQTTEKEVKESLWALEHRKRMGSSEEISSKEYNDIRIRFGDRSKYVMDDLVAIMKDSTLPLWERRLAGRYFVRGATRQGFVGPSLSPSQQQLNSIIGRDNHYLREQLPGYRDSEKEVDAKNAALISYFDKEQSRFEKTFGQKVWIFFFETRFARYLTRVLTLDFGTLRDDNNKTVINEVVRRFKYSLTLSIIPMFITFFLCIILGFAMAVYQNRWIDHTLNVICLVFYAIPVFVVVPFLIEKIALQGHFPFTDVPIPLTGFTSADQEYNRMTSGQRFVDVLRHIALPLVAVTYGGLAAQARLARTSILEVLRQDYVRTARAKGLGSFTVLWKHVGRNAAITLVTAIAGSLGVILGGSLIIETLFEINGFGKFFYDAVINRDYNVIMFSALAGAFLSLVGYLVADIAYTLLDPRVTLE